MRTAIAAALGAVLVAAAVVLFAPARLGGRFAYFRIVGTSMEPMLHGGDLAVIHRADRYDVGDSIAYRDPVLGAVLHRIRAADGTRFVTRGVNRHEDDTYHPSSEDITGKLLLRIPSGGALLAAAQQPRNAALVAAAVALLAMPASKRYRTGTRRDLTPRADQSTVRALSSTTAGNIVTLSAVALLAAIALAVLLRPHGPTRVVTHDSVIEQVGRWQYGGGSGGRNIYDANTVVTGQPLFVNLDHALPLRFSYDIAPVGAADTVEDVQGHVSIVATLSASNKWSRTIELLASVPFEGSSATAATVLDISALLRMVTTLEEQTGVKFGTYQVQIAAHVETNAVVGGETNTQNFVAPLSFDLTTQQLVPTSDPAERITNMTRVPHRTTEPWSARAPLSGTTLTYRQIEALAALLGATGLLGLLFVGTSEMRLRRATEGSIIRTRHAAAIVRAPSGFDATDRILAVSSFAELLRIAAQEGALILDVPNATMDTFLVSIRGSDLSYLFATPRARTSAASTLTPQASSAAVDLSQFVTELAVSATLNPAVGASPASAAAPIRGAS